jgi:hypothetical protein
LFWLFIGYLLVAAEPLQDTITYKTPGGQRFPVMVDGNNRPKGFLPPGSWSIKNWFSKNVCLIWDAVTSQQQPLIIRNLSKICWPVARTDYTQQRPELLIRRRLL